MFGFGNRKKYNGVVDTKLNNEYQIVTHNNPRFGGALAYLEMIDHCYYQKWTEDECALYVAICYYSGLLTHGYHSDASSLLGRINSIVAFSLPRGMISQDLWSKFSRAIELAKKETGVA